MFDPQRGAHYFNDSELFEASARGYVVATFGEEWADKFRLKGSGVGGVHWYDAYCSCVRISRCIACEFPVLGGILDIP